MLRKLNNSGLAHYVVPLIFIAVVTISGVAMLVISHANPVCKTRCSKAKSRAKVKSVPTPHRSVTFTAGMTIDSDGSGPDRGDCCHQAQTSYDPYSHGRINAVKASYIALAPGWAVNHGISLGDLAVVKYKNKRAFAIYADNYMGDAVHGEGSIHLAHALGINDSPRTGGVPYGVTYTLYPGSNIFIGGSIAQSKFDSVGRQYTLR